MKSRKRLNTQRQLRARRTRAKIFGTAERPRFSVFRSNKFIYAQLINDQNQKTLVAGSTKELINGKTTKQLNKTQLAAELGKVIGEKAKKAKISQVVFDKGRYRFHGRVKAVADGAREAGLQF
ncbi:MAG: 50S ribosomal protein L18 [Patescibacteria group bacterium]